MTTAHDFDFLHGDWTIRNRRRENYLDPSSGWQEFPATHRCWALFDGAANVDEMDCPSQGFKGATLRLFDPAAKEWSLYWSSSRTGTLEPPVRGGFGDDGRGVFEGDDSYAGTPIRVRFLWLQVTPTSARWEQAFRTDEDGDWLTNWIMDFTRV
ncbi:hypothetical protein ACFVT5_21785 [Streptomyces sp. NPDC058001]|uniref:hypothetical protein n=1 Tax=Streptomyces sp. NPDC058001 TaxID=3346300 RepID=UPI0036EC5D14